MQNVISHKLSALLLALLCPNDDMKKTSKSKLLKEVEITEYSKLRLLVYQHVSATAINFMATIQLAGISKFERFSNVADGITYKIISSFRGSNLLIIGPDRYKIEL